MSDVLILYYFANIVVCTMSSIAIAVAFAGYGCYCVASGYRVRWNRQQSICREFHYYHHQEEDENEAYKR